MVVKEPARAETISVDGGKPRAWADARRRLARGSTYWLCTIRAGGAPHLVPVLAVIAEGTLHFVASEASRKARNMALDPRCAIGVGTDDLDLVVEGEAVRVTDGHRLRVVADAYASKYDWQVTVRDTAFHDTEGAPTAGPPPYVVYEVIPASVFGFGTTEPARSTRWSFGAPDRPSHIEKGSHMHRSRE